MGRFRNLLVAAMLAILALASSGASDIYIAQTATGGNTGLDCADAYASTFFNTSSNWGTAAGQIGPGATVHICGTLSGAANATILAFQGSGTSGSPITLKFENGASLSAPYCGSFTNGAACLVMSTPNAPHEYITVDGGTPCGWTNAGGSEGTCNGTIVNTASGSSLSYTGASTAGIEAQACTNCEIKNLGIYNLYIEGGGATTANPQYENCVAYSGSNISIHDNQMHDVGWCIFYSMRVGDTNNSVYRNDIYNTPHPVFFATASGISGTATNSFYYSNHFHDYANWDTAGCVFHVEGIHSSGPGTAPFPVFNDLEIYNNYFGPNEGSCLFAQVFFSTNTNTAGSAGLVNNSTIFNNVFDMTETGYGPITMGAGNGNAVYNNTLLGPASNSMIALNWSNVSQNSGYIFSFKNNAMQTFYTFVSNDMNGSEGPGITANYNVYADCTDAMPGCLNAFVKGGTSTWATYQANSFGQELQSTTAGLNSGKCCTGTLGLDTAYVPQGGSVVIGAGANLSALCTGNLTPLCSDATGNPRPAAGAWDAGAYQYSGLRPMAPTQLPPVVQ